MLVLRKCWRDGSSCHGFVYGQVGDRVTAPDWNPERKCGGGLHGLLECNGDWNLLDGKDWLLIDADDQIVEIDSDKCKFNTGVIIYRGPKEGLINHVDVSKFTNNTAYNWALNIGNHDVMIDRITDINYAYSWISTFGRSSKLESLLMSNFTYVKEINKKSNISIDFNNYLENNEYKAELININGVKCVSEEHYLRERDFLIKQIKNLMS